jgi:hypothetical protein
MEPTAVEPAAVEPAAAEAARVGARRHEREGAGRQERRTEHCTLHVRSPKNPVTPSMSKRAGPGNGSTGKYGPPVTLLCVAGVRQFSWPNV